MNAIGAEIVTSMPAFNNPKKHRRLKTAAIPPINRYIMNYSKNIFKQKNRNYRKPKQLCRQKQQHYLKNSKKKLN